MQVEDAHHLLHFLAEKLTHITRIMNHLMTSVLIYQIMLERPIKKYKAVSHSIAMYGPVRLLCSLAMNYCVNQGVIRICKQSSVYMQHIFILLWHLLRIRIHYFYSGLKIMQPNKVSISVFHSKGVSF